MVMGDGEGVGLTMTDANEFFYKSQVFHEFILMRTILIQCGFFKQLLVQNDLIFKSLNEMNETCYLTIHFLRGSRKGQGVGVG